MPVTCSICGLSQAGVSTYCARCGSPLPGLGTGQLPAHFALQQGRYLIVRAVGHGGMGAVYQAADTRLGGKVVAIKEMSDAGLPTPQQRQQASHAFRQEAQMLALLNHPNLPKVSDFFTENGKHYIAMEFVEGETLEDHLNRRGGSVSEAEARGWAAQLCDVLSYLHRQQPPVIFRDLKPANVMLTPQGQLKLIDFGIARFFKAGQAGDTVAMGTPGYAAPEQYGQGQTDVRSDVYSLGVLLHHALTGYEPSLTPFILPSVQQFNRNASLHIVQVIERAVDVQPTRRFPSVDAMRQALVPLSTAPPPPVAAQRSASGWMLGVAAGAALMLMIFLALQALGLLSPSSSSRPSVVVSAVDPPVAPTHELAPPPAASGASTPPTTTPLLPSPAPVESGVLTTVSIVTPTAAIESSGVITLYFGPSDDIAQPSTGAITNTTPVTGSGILLTGGWVDTEMVYVPAGEFLMGSIGADSIAADDEKPQHAVYLSDYWIGLTQVTNSMFARFVAATGYQTDAEMAGSAWTYDPSNRSWADTPGASWRSPFGSESNLNGLEEHPVVQVSWNDAVAYCQWAGKRLPTEAEWEKAARGVGGRAYPWGDEWDSGRVNSRETGRYASSVVGSYPFGASPYGALDMAGNVWEWVSDWYSDSYYSETPYWNPTGPAEGPGRVLRGGSWFDPRNDVRTSERYRGAPDGRVANFGFRCAYSLSE
jgi:formylglycine-generating enzyme required for sulfatase activity/serine/threonine protein kinase